MTCVGLNTVPAWCRPFQCLSNGQQERVLLAVALCDGAVLDDFGAVLDEASARGAAASLRKRVAAEGLRRVLVATSKAEVVSWLGADFVLWLQIVKYRYLYFHAQIQIKIRLRASKY